MKRTASIVMAICLTALLMACGAPQAEPATPNTCLPTVAADEILSLPREENELLLGEI